MAKKNHIHVKQRYIYTKHLYYQNFHFLSTMFPPTNLPKIWGTIREVTKREFLYTSQTEVDLGLRVEGEDYIL